ncbi:MAG: hypothetical protein ACTMUB_05605 [cyanobacterium endosymbiont of Rhopalodia musculus]|uniref:hypothetical protein n=1 Tax=cyanobacterium endosymbiont of Epithemia clementina EcSB TaxID=3034674 RepID=UPI002480CAC7|nr:hypothetical protein [cyanobacterium endosymbiont of Epithemia clementina EcSB]WGT67619.1 hypothetical protein P3F56_00465 [cyanobacterium endosymbiont of Epithemia clementina EcSB]
MDLEITVLEEVTHSYDVISLDTTLFYLTERSHQGALDYLKSLSKLKQTYIS